MRMALDNVCEVPRVLTWNQNATQGSFLLHVSPPPLKPPFNEASVTHQKLFSPTNGTKCSLSSSLESCSLPAPL